MNKVKIETVPASGKDYLIAMYDVSGELHEECYPIVAWRLEHSIRHDEGWTTRTVPVTPANEDMDYHDPHYLMLWNPLNNRHEFHTILSGTYSTVEDMRANALREFETHKKLQAELKKKKAALG